MLAAPQPTEPTFRTEKGAGLFFVAITHPMMKACAASHDEFALCVSRHADPGGIHHPEEDGYDDPLDWAILYGEGS